tara:strand:- start:3863 stop:4129 length:267 start_codon:yes stop_codon:yes gene_type:complete
MSNCVILTIKGWDGSRILGVFDSMEAANAVKINFLKEKNIQKNDYRESEEFIFDVVEINKVSKSCTLYASSDSDQIIRNHVYDVYDSE